MKYRLKDRELATTAKTKSLQSQRAVEHQTLERTADGTPSPQRGLQMHVTSRVGNAASARAHAMTLNQVTVERPAHTGQILLRLQRQYGNHYVQRVLALARQADGEAEVAPEVEQAIQRARGSGQALDSKVRVQMESAFGTDFDGVRVHTGAQADTLNRALHARAFATGQDIFFRQGEYKPGSLDRRELLAHELTHVVQQGGGVVRGKLSLSQSGDKFEQEADQMAGMIMGLAGNRISVQNAGAQQVQDSSNQHQIQRRLIATGSNADVADFISLVGPAIGLILERDAATNEIQAIGSSGSPTSPALQTILTRIMDDPGQDAEVNIGRGQARVAVGAFPTPADLTAGRVQRIDIDDLLDLEAGAPGSGLAKVAHEIQENYHAHSFPVVAGTSRFRPSHREGVAAESRVAEELVGPGERVAAVDAPIGSNVFTRVQDFTNYYLVFDLTRVGTDFSVSNARHAPKVNVSTRTIDNFVTGSAAIPAAGAATIALVVADLAANPTATVLIEGFTDNVGSAGSNVTLSQDRARQARNGIIAAGATGGTARFHIVGRGETSFVAPNNNEANRARNRRVVIIVTRPGP